MGHAVKPCLLGMRIAEILNVSVEARSDLYYALLLKDAGCSSDAARMYEIFGGDERAAKKEVKTTDWSRVTFEGLEYLMRNVMPGRSRLDRVIAIAHIAINRKDQSTELFQLRCERGSQIAKQSASRKRPPRRSIRSTNIGRQGISPWNRRPHNSRSLAHHERMPDARSLRRRQRPAGRLPGGSRPHRHMV
jgi:hypothetical protein